MSDSSSPSGPSNSATWTCVAALGTPAGREADGGLERGRRPAAITGTPAISSPRRRAGAARRTRGRAARPASGSARRSAPSNRPLGEHRRRLGVGPQPLERRPVARARPRRGARSTCRTAARASRRPAGRPRCRPCRRRGGARRPGRRARSRRRRAASATTSRPWRRSATCIVSKSASWGGLVQVASAARSSGATRARRCARNWRTLDAHQEGR